MSWLSSAILARFAVGKAISFVARGGQTPLRSEFQVVQFIPLIITPQIVLCGIWWPLQSVPEFIRPFFYILPLTYAAHALRAVMLKGAGVAEIFYPDLLALGLFFLIFFAAATMMLRREVG